MKKIFSILAIAISVAIALGSCKKKDDTDTQQIFTGQYTNIIANVTITNQDTLHVSNVILNVSKDGGNLRVTGAIPLTDIEGSTPITINLVLSALNIENTHIQGMPVSVCKYKITSQPITALNTSYMVAGTNQYSNFDGEIQINTAPEDSYRIIAFEVASPNKEVVINVQNYIYM